MPLSCLSLTLIHTRIHANKLLITAQPIRNLQTPASAEMNKRRFLQQASLPLSPPPLSLFTFFPIPYPFRRLLRRLVISLRWVRLHACWNHTAANILVIKQCLSKIGSYLTKFAKLAKFFRSCVLKGVQTDVLANILVNCQSAYWTLYRLSVSPGLDLQSVEPYSLLVNSQMIVSEYFTKDHRHISTTKST